MKFYLLAIVLFQILGESEEPRNREGNEAYEEGKHDDALRSYTQAQIDYPDAAEIHYNIGNIHYQKEDLDIAIQEYETALHSEPKIEKQAHYNIGNAYFRKGALDKAVHAYSESLKIDSSDLEAQQNLEFALRQQQEQQQQDKSQSQDRGGDDENRDQRDKDKNKKNDEQSNESPQLNQDAQENEQNQPEQWNQESTDENSGPKMSQAQAEQILQALQQMEEDFQRREHIKRKSKAKGRGRIW